MTGVNRNDWIAHGVENGWLAPVCLMHNFYDVMTDEELRRVEIDGDDPCIARFVTTEPEDAIAPPPKTLMEVFAEEAEQYHV